MTMKETICQMLHEADAIYVGDSPLLGSFMQEPEAGKLVFNWEDLEGEYEIVIPAVNLNKAKIDVGGDIEVHDENGDEITIQCYKLVQLTGGKKA